MTTATTGVARPPARVARKPLRIGVVGVGRIGTLHAELIAHEVTGVRLEAVYDPVSERSAELAARLAVRPERNALSLIEADDIDAVAICSSTDTHVEFIEAAAAGGKAIFCEKPISLDLATLDRVNALVDGSGLVFQVGFNRRFDPSHASVRQAVVAGEVGDPHLLRITSRDPEPPPADYTRVSGGLFLDMTAHDFDLARFVVGSEVVEVFARGAARIDPGLARDGDVDTAVTMLVHEDGCMTSIDNSRRARYGYDQRVEVFGSAGMARSENQSEHSGMVFTAAGEGSPALKAFFLDRYRESYRRGWEAFVEAVTRGTAPFVGGGDARSALVIGIAATRSLHEGRSVRIEEIESA